MKTKATALGLVVVLAAFPALLTGCASLFGGSTKAVAEVKPLPGSRVRGTVLFEQRGQRVMVIARLNGLPPETEHGFHIYEKGDCSAPEKASAGRHFNPEHQAHGHYGSAERHAGDLPNLKADSQGMAQVSFEIDSITVIPGPYSIVGRALVVDRNADDFKTQPDGSSGPAIGCAVIGLQ